MKELKGENIIMDNIQDLQTKMQQIKEEQQDKFITKLLEDVEYLCEKANHQSYNPTNYEREIFNRIRIIINNMNDWF